MRFVRCASLILIIDLFSAFVTLVNCISVRLATTVQNVFCFCKLLAIGIIICGGIYQISLGERVDFLKDSHTGPVHLKKPPSKTP